jgi:galactose mutarotase-like enzyme
MKLKKGTTKDFFEVDLHGARKTLTLNGVPILIETQRADGKVGSTHPCTPNFANPENTYGLPQHGPALNADWKVLTQTEDSLTIVYSIEGGTFPKGLKIVQTLRINNGLFEIYTVHTHAGTEPAPLIYGEHFYWDAPNSLQNMKLNEVELQDLYIPPEGALLVLDEKNALQISGKPAINLEQENMPVGILWQGKGDSSYVCIEPVTMNPYKDEEGKPYFGSAKSMLKPGETKTAYVSISLR